MFRHSTAMLALALTAADCGSSDPAGPGGGGRVVKPDPSLSVDVFEVFTRRGCTAGAATGAERATSP